MTKTNAGIIASESGLDGRRATAALRLASTLTFQAFQQPCRKSFHEMVRGGAGKSDEYWVAGVRRSRGRRELAYECDRKWKRTFFSYHHRCFYTLHFTILFRPHSTNESDSHVVLIRHKLLCKRAAASWPTTTDNSTWLVRWMVIGDYWLASQAADLKNGRTAGCSCSSRVKEHNIIY